MSIIIPYKPIATLGTIRVAKEVIRLGLEFPSQEEFDELVFLAVSANPFNNLYGYLQLDRKRLMKIEAYVYKDMAKQYVQMMAKLRRELEDLSRDIQGGRTNISTLVQFVQSANIMELIAQRVKEIEPIAEGIITQGIIDSSQLAAQSWLRDATRLAKLNQIDDSMLANIKAMMRPNLVAAELTIPLAVGDTRNISDALIQQISSKLREGAIEGKSMRQIIQSVGELENLPKLRAELITRWAMIKGYNEERLARMKDSGIDRMAKVWHATLDHRVCPHCLALHGQIMKMDTEFDGSRTFAKKPIPVYMGLQTPPRHPR